MNFSEIANARQSCRSFDAAREVEEEKLLKILNSTILAPSACNSQPYHITVCTKEVAHEIAFATTSMGMNKFTLDAPVMIVVSEEAYNTTAALGAKVKHNDYRSIDIGIAVAYLTAEATALGLSTCIIGWFDNDKIKKLCSLDGDVRLIVALGYASPHDKLRPKKRKAFDQIITIK